MKVMTCNLAEIILQPSTEITSSSYWYNFKQFPLQDYFLKNLFLPENGYKYKTLISLPVH